MTTRIRLYLTNAQVELLDARAAQDETTIARVISDAVDAYFGTSPAEKEPDQ